MTGDNPFVSEPPGDANQQISKAVSCLPAKSFFLFAGAGSGKTRSLILALEVALSKRGRQIELAGRKIGVITYTKAARDEIIRRLKFDSRIHVATLHSFAWDLIQGLNGDIRTALARRLSSQVTELVAAEARGRSGTATSLKRQQSIAKKRERLNQLHSIRHFDYSPDSHDGGAGSLSHSEVIWLCADLLREERIMRELLVGRCPIVFVDESQDTHKDLIESLLFVESQCSDRFCIGLFGDMMQRIYADGKADLVASIPAAWARPEITVNHRCPKRIVRLINRIRSRADSHVQSSSDSACEGWARLFIVSESNLNKEYVEERIRQRMSEITGDSLWTNRASVKTLLLEHHMAANRLGFLELFESLHVIEEFRTPLLNGSLSILRFFSEQVLPAVKSFCDGNQFGVATVLRRYSPLLARTQFEGNRDVPAEIMRRAKEAVRSVAELWDDEQSPTFGDVLQRVADSRLFEIPEYLETTAAVEGDVSHVADGVSEDEGVESAVEEALQRFLKCEFSQIEPYVEYVSGRTEFATHQGVKGLEFPRVCVVIDDNEMRGFSFSYEKLLSAREPSERGAESFNSGKETSIDRTRRLFYVTCSRSRESLAIVAYTAAPRSLRERAVNEEWFDGDEIEEVT